MYQLIHTFNDNSQRFINFFPFTFGAVLIQVIDFQKSNESLAIR